ncbi:MAG: BMP family ABC transporter substrate-binding protein [Caldilineaceae bacterium]|nr:BMP family ABC transporter substrate-binding protein [Caldilineaceae bacterium]
MTLLLISLLLVACPAPAAPVSAPPQAAPPQAAAPTTAAPEEPVAAAPSDFQIGLVTDVGRVNDRSFNQSAWEGVQQAAQALGLPETNIRFIETQSPTDYADNIQQFIDAGYQVIVTVGFALGDATIEAANENPDVYFIGVDQFQVEALPNLAGLIFSEDKSGFLAGVLAARLSESGIIASVLGTDLVPPVVAFGTGYENGARYANPDISVITTYHPGGLDIAFTDPEWGAATAAQALDQGADVIFGAGGQTGNGALQEVASRVTADQQLYCIGVDSDQWETVPAARACLVSSAMKLITPGVVELAALAAEGNFPGGNYVGDVGLAPFHDFEDSISQEIKDELDEIRVGLEDGSISTGY